LLNDTGKAPGTPVAVIASLRDQTPSLRQIDLTGLRTVWPAMTSPPAIPWAAEARPEPCGDAVQLARFGSWT
jgi:hypothetical protein